MSAQQVAASAPTPPSNRPNPRGSPAIDTMLLLLVVGIYVVVQLSLLKPPSLEGGDQLDYFRSAAELPDVTPTHRHLRIGLLLPVRAAIELFGYSEAAYYAIPLLSGVVLCGSAYMLARLLFSRGVALAASLLVVLNPYVLWDSSHLLPDVLATALFTAAVVSLVQGALCFRANEESAPRGGLLLAFGGLLLGWAYLTREYILILFPVVLVLLYVYRLPVRRLGWVVLGAAPALVFEVAWGALLYGDPFIRFATASGIRGRGGSGRYYATEVGEVLWILPSNFLQRSGGWVFVVLFVTGILFGLVAATRGHRQFLLPVAWTGGTWLALTLVGMVPVLLLLADSTGTLLRLQKVRYWLPIFPGLVIGGLAVLDLGIRSTFRKFRVSGLLASLSMILIVSVTAVIGVGSISHSGSFVSNGSTQYVELRAFLADQGSSYPHLYTDQGVGQALGLVLPMYTRTVFGDPIWDGEIRALANRTRFEPVEEIVDGLVVIRPASIRWLVNNREGFDPPQHLTNPPPNWEPVLITQEGDIVVYRVLSDPLSAPLQETSATNWEIVDPDGEVVMPTPPPETKLVTFEAPADRTVSIRNGRATTQTGGTSVGAGDAVWGRIEMAVTGSGRLELTCEYSHGEGTETVVATVRGRHGTGIELVDYICPAPRTAGKHRVTLVANLRGPIELTMGGNVIYLAAST